MLKTGRGVLSRSQHPELMRIAARLKQCSPRRRCHLPYCPKCGISKASKKRLEKSGKIPLGTSRPVSLHNPRSKARGVIRALFGHLPEDNIGCITIHLGAARNPLDAESSINLYRSQFNGFLKSKLPDSKVWMAFEVKSIRVKNAGQDIYSDSRWKQEFEPDDIVWLVHAHGLIYSPSITPKDMKAAFKTRKDGKRSRYAGSRQVDIRPVKHAPTENGGDNWGMEGFAEYAIKMHFEPIKYAENCRLYEDWALLISRLRRKNKHLFRFGTNKYPNISLAVSPPVESIIDVLSKLSVLICPIINSILLTHWFGFEKQPDIPRPVRVSEKSQPLLDQPSNRGPPSVMLASMANSNVIFPYPQI